MKRFILLQMFLLCNVLLVCSQSVVYVAFTSTKSEVKGVWDSIFGITSRDRDAAHLFTLFDRGGGIREHTYFYRFIYSNEVNSIDNPYQIKSKEFINSVTLIDWDLVKSISDAESKYKYILSHDKIYFINKNESTNDSVKLYPVKLKVAAGY